VASIIEENVPLPPITRSFRGRLPRGRRTPERDFYPSIIRALARRDGRARPSEFMAEIGAEMTLTPDDLRLLPSGELRWHKTVHWARRKMVEEGLLRRGSDPGFWELP